MASTTQAKALRGSETLIVAGRLLKLRRIEPTGSGDALRLRFEDNAGALLVDLSAEVEVVER